MTYPGASDPGRPPDPAGREGAPGPQWDQLPDPDPFAPGWSDRGTSTGSARGRAFRESAGGAARAVGRGLDTALGGPARTRVVLVLAGVLALASADSATVGASADELKKALHISPFQVGLLVAVTALVGAVASVPFGVLVDRTNRIGLLGVTVALWGFAMLASAAVSTFGALLLVRLFLGVVTATAGPAVASLVGDYFTGDERGKIYGYVLAGELVGAGVGFVITGDVAALSWRAAFVVLAIPAFGLAWVLRTLREPARGGASHLPPGATEIIGRKEAAQAAQEAPTVIWEPGSTGRRPDEPQATDAQELAFERHIEPDPALILRQDPRRMPITEAVKYVLRVRTNVVLIVSSACAYFFLTGVQTFGLSFALGQYRVSRILANGLMLVVGGGAVVGVLVGGRVGDALVQRRRINGRITVAGIAALLTVACFIPALVTREALTALPYVSLAALFLTAQNPPLDAARLDIMPPLLWGRAEGIRTFLRTGAQALAPLVFGGLWTLFGGNTAGLRTTFIIMLLPLAASGVILLRGRRHYPRDVATAAASLTFQPPVTDPPSRRGRRWRRRH